MEKKTVIITGGAQGIGRFAAEYLLKKGLIAIVADIDEEAGEETFSDLKKLGEITFIKTDVSDEKDVTSLMKQVTDRYGRIDTLINNAAISANKPVTGLTAEEWNRVISVNLTGTFLCSKHAAPWLKTTRGSIINMASTRAFMSEKNTEAYSASKGGIFALTHALAMSLGPEVRVNSISPGWIDVSSLKKEKVRKQEVLSEADHQQHPSGRVGNAGDIASMIWFLMDPENSFITGQNFTVDGGMTRKMIYV